MCVCMLCDYMYSAYVHVYMCITICTLTVHLCAHMFVTLCTAHMCVCVTLRTAHMCVCISLYV